MIDGLSLTDPSYGHLGACLEKRDEKTVGRLGVPHDSNSRVLVYVNIMVARYSAHVQLSLSSLVKRIRGDNSAFPIGSRMQKRAGPRPVLTVRATKGRRTVAAAKAVGIECEYRLS